MSHGKPPNRFHRKDKAGAEFRGGLNTWELRKGVEMCVPGAQNKRVLQHEGCDPHVIGRDGSALLSELAVDRGIVMGGLFVGIENTNAGLEQKSAQDSFITRSLAAYSKSGAQFSEHDEGQPDFMGTLYRLNNRSIAAAKIGVAVCIERQLHRHISSSIVS